MIWTTTWPSTHDFLNLLELKLRDMVSEKLEEEDGFLVRVRVDSSKVDEKSSGV